MNKTQRITHTALFLALALTIQFLRFPQPITGPVINAILLLSTMLVGPCSAMIIGCLTPGIAFVFGIIPPVLGPLVPFVVLANIILIVVYYLVYQYTFKQSWLSSATGYQFFLLPFTIKAVGVGLAALAKFGFLFWVTQSLVNYLYLIGWINVTIPPAALLAFQLPQLYTALAGGILAIVLHCYLQKAKKALR